MFPHLFYPEWTVQPPVAVPHSKPRHLEEIMHLHFNLIPYVRAAIFILWPISSLLGLREQRVSQ